MATPRENIEINRIELILRAMGWEQAGMNIEPGAIRLTFRRGRGGVTTATARNLILQTESVLRQNKWDLIASRIGDLEIEIEIERRREVQQA